MIIAILIQCLFSESIASTEGAIKIESIFIGNKISLQVKLYEAVVRRLDQGMRKLLSRPTSSKVHETIQNKSKSSAK